MRRTVGFLIRCWCPVVIWLAIIALESTTLLSSDNTASLLYRLAMGILGHVNLHQFEIVHAVLRKVGHFVGYAILCLLLFRALHATYAGRLRRWALMAVGMTFLVASADELHQSFLPSRTGRFHDVLLDTAGAICIQLIVLAILRKREQRVLAPCDRADLDGVIPRSGSRRSVAQLSSKTDAQQADYEPDLPPANKSAAATIASTADE